MSESILNQRRNKLLREINIAKKQLSYNLDNIEPKSYLPTRRELIPDIITNTINGTSHLLSTFEPILKTLLPKDNKLSTTYNILKIIASDDD